MRLSLLLLAETQSAPRRERAKLLDGQVYCHRCSGFGRGARDLDKAGCAVCDGTGVLKRDRFGVVNGVPQNLSANEATRYINGVDPDGLTYLGKRAVVHDHSENGQISIFESPAAIHASDATPSDAIECRLSLALPDGAQPPTSFMVMPAGLHKITPSQGGKPVVLTVQVDRDSARMMQAALEAHMAAGPQRPWFNFDHNKQGPASAWPTSFEWRDKPEPGVYAHVEWTKAGAEAITGKMYRAFSPGFFVDSISNNPARISGAPLDMGALVNEPAFKKISPLWAADGSTIGAEGKQKVKMNEQELAALRARLDKLEKENSELRASQASSENTLVITAKDEEITQLKQALTKVDGELKAQNKAKAKAAVLAAVARGALPPKDEPLQARWAGLIEADPANEVLLANLAGNPALAPVTAANNQRSDAIQASGISISREDSHRVLLAYAQETNPLKRGQIYASDMSARIRKGEAFPLILREQDAVRAANSVGTLAGDIVSQRVLEYLMTSFPQFGRISTDMSAEVVKFNNTVDVQLVSPPAVTTYVPGTGYTTSNAVVTTVPVKIDQHKAVQIAFNTEELGSTDRNLFQEQVPLMAYVLAKEFLKLIYSKITVAAFPKATNETVISLAGFDRKGVMKLGRKLTDREVADVNRMLLLTGTYYDKLGEDTVVVSAFNNPNASDVIQSGVLPDVHGFGVADAKFLQAAENLVGFACFGSALAFASRLPDDYTKALPGVTGGAITRVITEAKSGVSLLQTQFVDHYKAEALIRDAIQFGAAVGDPSAGERLCSAATP